VTTHDEVDDIENEWLDRYGPVPEPASALLRIGHLRAECARIGVHEVAVVTGGAGLGSAGFTARLSPIELKASQRVRLARIAPKAVYKEDSGQLVIPLPRGSDPAADLVALLGQLAPPVASPAQ
jgi:transcription-repair coupling factor (superfamily II helicase)